MLSHNNRALTKLVALVDQLAGDARQWRKLKLCAFDWREAVPSPLHATLNGFVRAHAATLKTLQMKTFALVGRPDAFEMMQSCPQLTNILGGNQTIDIMHRLVDGDAVPSERRDKIVKMCFDVHGTPTPDDRLFLSTLCTKLLALYANVVKVRAVVAIHLIIAIRFRFAFVCRCAVTCSLPNCRRSSPRLSRTATFASCA